MDNALIIFARKPELGKVKTRLAATIGNQKALHIYKRLLAHTKEIATAVNCATFVFLTEPTNDGYWNNFNIEIQYGETLGDRMLNAFKLVFDKGYKKGVIIGSDCPTLSENMVLEAFNALTKNQVVIGPAVDGGYYLLGMQQLQASFFENKNWSTDSVFKQTIVDIEKANLTCYILPTLNDVDELADVPMDWLNNTI